MLVDNALNRLDKSEAKVLILKYIDNVPTNLASDVMKISMRTFFRKIKIAIQNFWIALTKNDFSLKKFYEMFNNEKWVLEIYDSFCKKGVTESNAKNVDAPNITIKSILSKKIDVSKNAFVGLAI